MSFEKYLIEIKQYAESEKLIDAIFNSIVYLKGIMQIRIFNSESGAKDSTNNKLTGKGYATYSAQYAKKRQAFGRQVANIDLEFTGNLRNSLEVIIESDNIILGIQNFEAEQAANGLEKRYKKEIFKPTEEELDETEQYLFALIEQDLEEIYNNNNNE